METVEQNIQKSIEVIREFCQKQKEPLLINFFCADDNNTNYGLINLLADDFIEEDERFLFVSELGHVSLVKELLYNAQVHSDISKNVEYLTVAYIAASTPSESPTFWMVAIEPYTV